MTRNSGRRSGYLLYCILGAIGSGKSTISGVLAERFPVLSADKIASEVVHDKRAQLALRFGSEIESGGIINKKLLSERIFGSERDRRWVAELVNGEVLRRIEQSAAESGSPLVFAEITAPSREAVSFFDGSVVVYTDLERALLRTDDRHNGWSRERRKKIYEIQKRDIDDALTDYAGDIIKVDNNGGFEVLQRIAGEITSRIFARNAELFGL